MYVLFKNIHKCLWRDIVCKLFLFLFKGWKMLLKLWKIFPMLQLPLVSITCKINKFYFTAYIFNEILPVYRLIIIYHKRNYHLLHFIVNMAVFILHWKRYADLQLQRNSTTVDCHQSQEIFYVFLSLFLGSFMINIGLIRVVYRDRACKKRKYRRNQRE